MMGIQSALEILETHDDDGAQHAARRVLGRQVIQMSRILDDLLDVSRLRRDEIEMQREVFDLRTAVDPVLAAVRSRLERSGVELQVDSPDEPLWIHADHSRMQQLMVNLVANAIKHTKKGRRVRLVLENDDGQATIVVADEGAGIAPDHIESIFEPFVQGDEARGESESGSVSMGLGLAVARAVARAHGGEISAASPGRGRGSTFIVRIPVATTPAVLPAESSPEPSNGARPELVLLVEDQQDNRELLSVVLAQAGYQVRTAGNGADAIRILESEPIEVAILDLGLPDMSGLDLARRARQLRDRDSLRLIALTGHGTQSIREAAMDAGFDEHLIKPVPFDTLRKVVEATGSSDSN